MRKRKIWIAGCTVLLLLLVCTVLSLRIEKMMRIEVETVQSIRCTEQGMEDMSRIPISCYRKENGRSVLFFVEEKEGLFGKELVVEEEEHYPVMEEENMALIVESSIMDDQGKPRNIVNYSIWPLEDGDVVVIAGNEE